MVKVFSTPTCYYCNVAKRYLRQKGIKFTNYNVAADSRRAQEMSHKSRQQGVPVIEINGKIIVGFDKNKIDKALKKIK